MKAFGRLPYPQLDVPAWQLVAMFRAVDQVLRADEVFSSTCNTFLSWTGAQADVWEPAWSLCPYCRISPFPTSSEWATEIQHKSPLTVHCEVAVQGTDFDQLGNFWGTIQAAIFPQGSAQRDSVIATLQAAGVTKPTIRMAAFVPTIDDNNNVILIGRGSIEFGSLIYT